VFAQPAPHAGVFDYDRVPARVECDCFAREGAGVPARFAQDSDKRQACFRVDHRHAHAHVPSALYVLKSVGRTSRDALQFILALAQVARPIPRYQIRRPNRDCRIGIGGMEHFCGADFNALRAADTSGQEFILVAGAGWTQIVRRLRLCSAKQQTAADRRGDYSTGLEENSPRQAHRCPLTGEAGYPL